MTYAVCYVLADADRNDVVLKVGSDDQAKVYLNGQEVYKSLRVRAFSLGQDEAKGLTLRKGTNVLVFKVVNVTEAWAGSIRFLGRGGIPLAGVQFRLEP